ncbi:MAG: hypothetical protein QG585_77 [Patescibacteria group bacterium]|nr:hypothetical protein [Patescibacteria group bacterium]
MPDEHATPQAVRDFIEMKPEEADDIPSKGQIISVIFQDDSHVEIPTDGQTSLRSLIESFFWTNKDKIREKTGLGPMDTLDYLFPTDDPLVWSVH